jgi:TolB-like protein/Flp pilus assembly protein TadD/predicted Ser/Thr protein kinase
MIGKKISHYEIIQKIGEGGMGEVFLARDTRLGRNVALKFVPDDIRDSASARERLLREATAASKLNHANIVGLYDIGEADGRDFIVMEYVDGRPLRDVIEAGDLDMDRALDLARQICRALGAAHDQDVIHRDVKSDNILITPGGEVKVLDFGLAKIEGAAKLTEDGSTVGTVAYMSPEQVQGRAVDGRSDLFSLGVLLYEMLTGRQPFRGEHRAAISYSIVNEDPEPLARYKSGIAEDLQRIVDKLLRKDRETRYQTAAGVLADLDALQKKPPRAQAAAPRTAARKWLVPGVIGIAVIALGVVGYLATRGGGAGDSGRILIAVLPFENLGQSEDEYFADGITEEITARLASIRRLGVIARTSILQYKETKKSIQQIGDELSVDYILEGTVRWQRGGDGPSRVRVTPQLIRVSDATHVWASVYDRPLTEVFELQTDIAMNVVGGLNVALLEPERQGIEAKPTDNLEAYDYYLRGESYFFGQVGQIDAVRIARGLFKRATELDPKFADAHAMLVVTSVNLHWMSEDRAIDQLTSAENSLQKAIQLDPHSFNTHMASGYFYYQGKMDYERALEHFENAKNLKPGAADTYASIGYVQRRQGKWDECLDNLKFALELDPRSAHLSYEIAETMLDLGRYDEADRYLDRTIGLAPDHKHAYENKIMVYVFQGDLERSRRVLDRAPPGSSFVEFSRAWISFLDRDFEQSVETLQAIEPPAFSDHFVFIPVDESIALAYFAMGDTSRGLAHFDSSRALLETLTESDSTDARLHSALGIAYAGLGRKEDAIRQGKLGIELMPVSKDSKRGPPRHEAMARIYTMVGEHDEAIDELEFILSKPAARTRVPLLRIDPTWDPLRGHPRFQKLIK